MGDKDIGWIGDRFFVNSAQSISCDKVDEAFGSEAEADGSASLKENKYYIVGRINVRRYIGENGGYTKRQANNLLKQITFLKKMHDIIDCANRRDIDAFLAHHKSERLSKWAKNLGLTDPPSSSARKR